MLPIPRLCAALLLCCGLAAISAARVTPAHASEGVTTNTVVQVFDVKQEQVVEQLAMTSEIREEASQWLQSVQGLSGRLEVGNRSGIVIRIPFVPAFTASVPKLSFPCSELYALIPERTAQSSEASEASETEENPLLLAFSTEGHMYVFECDYRVVEPFLVRHELLQYVAGKENNR